MAEPAAPPPDLVYEKESLARYTGAAIMELFRALGKPEGGLTVAETCAAISVCVSTLSYFIGYLESLGYGDKDIAKEVAAVNVLILDTVAGEVAKRKAERLEAGAKQA